MNTKVIDLILENKDLVISEEYVCISKKYLEHLDNIDQLKSHIITKPIPDKSTVINF